MRLGMTLIICTSASLCMWSFRFMRYHPRNAEGRIQNEEWRKGSPPAFSILHSAFCVLHSFVRPGVTLRRSSTALGAGSDGEGSPAFGGSRAVGAARNDTHH